MIPSLASMLGRLFMVGLPSTRLDDSTSGLIREYGINNFILFSRNVSEKEQLRKLCDDLRQACLARGLGAPLISIDQEGGSVARLPPPFTQFPDARKLAEGPRPEEEVAGYAGICARELAAVGINMNLAPVLDVCAAGCNYFMERRSLGHDAQAVARLGSLIIKKMQDGGVAACAKHFPGLGAAIVDPHLELPVVGRSLAALQAVDLVPFQAAFLAGVASVMTSHTIYPHLDPQAPATMSRSILTGLLRGELGYDGLIITDDLEMGAIEKKGSLENAALQALRAGADLLLICHDHDKAARALATIAAAMREDGEVALRIKASSRRVAAVQERFTLQYT